MFIEDGWWRMKEFEKIVMPKKVLTVILEEIYRKNNGDQPFKTQVDLMGSPISAGDSFEFESSPVFLYAGPSGLYLVCHAECLLNTSDHTAREEEEAWWGLSKV